MKEGLKLSRVVLVYVLLESFINLWSIPTMNHCCGSWYHSSLCLLVANVLYSKTPLTMDPHWPNKCTSNAKSLPALYHGNLKYGGAKIHLYTIDQSQKIITIQWAYDSYQELVISCLYMRIWKTIPEGHKVNHTGKEMSVTKLHYSYIYITYM